MARKDLIGLAALGALGKMIYDKKAGEGKDSAAAVESLAKKAAAPEYSDDTYDPDIRTGRADVLDEAGVVNPRLKRNTETGDLYSPDEPITRPGARRSTKAAAPRKVQAAVDTKPMGGSGGGRGPAIGEVEAYQRNKPMTREQSLARLNELTGTKEMDPNAKRGPNAADSTELGRNISNALNATAGLSVPGYVGKMTQAQYNARAASRRAAGDLTEAEIAAAKAAHQAEREAKTLNPNAWLAGPRGMAENFKKGGKVKAEKPAAKGWGKARSARAAKYY